MQLTYRSVPTVDCIDATDGVTFQSFEIEGARSRHDNGRSGRHNLAIAVWFIFVFAVMAVVGYGRHKKDPVRETPNTTDHFLAPKPKMIFCYGDSLTYGFPPPATPYAESLERELNNLYYPALDSDSSSPRSETHPPHDPPVNVQHLGIPGYTAAMMLNHFNDENTGLCPVIRLNRTISLVIILVGTNDIAVTTDTTKDGARSILQNIVDLHSRALECHADKDYGTLHTMAIGIPGSAYQDMTHSIAESATYINEGLKNFASSNSRISYFDFPFPYRENDGKWDEDGTHMSEEGYKQLGRSLAPQVKEILDSIDFP